MYERNIFVLHIYMKRKFYGNLTNSLEEKNWIDFIVISMYKQSTYFFFNIIKTNKIHIIFEKIICNNFKHVLVNMYTKILTT